MDWVLSEIKPIIEDATEAENGTYFATYTNAEDETKELTARVSIDGMWKEVVMTVYFPPIVDDSNPLNESQEATENVDSNQQNEDEDREQVLDLDSDSIAILALLLLLNIVVVAAIIVVRSRSGRSQDHRQRAMAEFERSLFDESGPVVQVPLHSSRVNCPVWNPRSKSKRLILVVESESTSTELPNFGDLLDDL